MLSVSTAVPVNEAVFYTMARETMDAAGVLSVDMVDGVPSKLPTVDVLVLGMGIVGVENGAFVSGHLRFPLDFGS
ncbi:hypothetical protein CHS0354_032659 [Potamilus streckersoni]|uniref:Uncharacterized protein n=1 Tax=Potamilus streckersoni TaxID=2493646 RepID=A0AAE0WET2_9BIVA|nr:hypothetical protein CHS0354_032659 [Potamilus streckersoni]